MSSATTTTPTVVNILGDEEPARVPENVGTMPPEEVPAFVPATPAAPEPAAAPAVPLGEEEDEESKMVERTVFYIQDGKLQKTKVSVAYTMLKAAEKQAQEHADASDEEDAAVEQEEQRATEAVTGVTADETAALEREIQKTLAAELDVNQRHCGERLAQLLKEDAKTKESPLYQMLMEMRIASEMAREKKPPTRTLYFCRTKRELDASDYQKVQWSKPACHNLLDPKWVKFFPNDTIYNYQVMHQDGVHMLVIDNIFNSPKLGGVVMQRMFVFFTLDAVERAQLDAAGAATNKLTVKSGTRREELHDKSLVVGSVFWGFAILQDKPDAAGVDESKRKSLERLQIARLAMERKRHKQRKQLLRRNLPVITNFITIAMARQLIKHQDDAGDNLPQRVIVRVPTEKCGGVIVVDGIAMFTQADLRAEKRAVEKELSEVGEQYKARVARGEKSDLQEFQRQIGLCESILVSLEGLDTAVRKVSPDGEILLQVLDYGQLEDKGDIVDILCRVVTDYDTMRAEVKQTDEYLAKMKADKEAQAVEDALNPTPPLPAHVAVLAQMESAK